MIPRQSRSDDAIKSSIREAGLRCTAARVAVLEHLLTLPGPVTHADVAQALAHRSFDRATIYRNLIELTEAKLATRVDLGDHVWRFEVRRHAEAGHRDDHPHFICIECGEISCLDDVKVAITHKAGSSVDSDKETDRNRRRAKKSARIRAVTEVLLKGQCENCSES